MTRKKIRGCGHGGETIYTLLIFLFRLESQFSLREIHSCLSFCDQEGAAFLQFQWLNIFRGRATLIGGSFRFYLSEWENTGHCIVLSHECGLDHTTQVSILPQYFRGLKKIKSFRCPVDILHTYFKW